MFRRAYIEVSYITSGIADEGQPMGPGRGASIESWQRPLAVKRAPGGVSAVPKCTTEGTRPIGACRLPANPDYYYPAPAARFGCR